MEAARTGVGDRRARPGAAPGGDHRRARAPAAEWGGRVAGVLYGGSVTVRNAAALLEVPGVDGLFVGRAAWDVDSFLILLETARRATAA
ncbi:triose-phosphate isomerase [Streptomyces scopuliridis]|uniref:Triose-phosphate isomerase n=1 Tax=Streptomyces scopuliridis TaxID=452529 RepID=A0ACD4ZEV8_9ACTN|nr:triose-phosphate isomerase [Streptomyces scopuliridis]WSB96999.1 triose-phosphate isomerase [Streptomyces scopuliridis]WSC09297.1 triose-phosphate isomerase [Streptomyces scopuliridis]